MKRTIIAILAVCALTILVSCFTSCSGWQVKLNDENAAEKQQAEQPEEQPTEQQAEQPTEQPAPEAIGAVNFWTAYREYTTDVEFIPCYIRNNLDEDISYGLDDKIQMLVDGEWKDLPISEECLYPSVSVGIFAGETNEYSVGVKRRYRMPLEVGSYRAVKCIIGEPGRNDLYAEFDIVEEG